jgi:hypothetical protein
LTLCKCPDIERWRGFCQLVFFAEFLATAGVFDRRVDACPLHCSSPNASRARDVLGTLMLGILAGSKRYAHIAGVCGDAVAAQALGLRGLVSEDSVRRALKAIEPQASEPWMRGALMDSVRDALDRPWVPDVDATIKPLYGHQEGAEIGYNPHKPGRPSHVLHAFWVGNLRLVLDAHPSAGKQHTSSHGKAALARLLDELGARGPALVRGDCGYGNEDTIDVCEQRECAYLLRRRIKDDVALTAGKGRKGRDKGRDKSKSEGRQMVLALPHDEVLDAAQLWEYTVLVTNVGYDLEGIGQLYRDRRDCENGFDELKNQWGWGGFTTQDMHRSQITARAVALVYNWYQLGERLPFVVRARKPDATVEVAAEPMVSPDARRPALPV